jgi:hypothetical protein
MTLMMIMMMISGTLFALIVFSRMLKVHDALIGVVASCSKIAASFVYAFAVTPFMFYFGPVTELIHYVSFIAMRSIASKIVEQDERVSDVVVHAHQLSMADTCFIHFRVVSTRWSASSRPSCRQSTRQCTVKYTRPPSRHFRVPFSSSAVVSRSLPCSSSCGCF